jgi:hypothetical protein
MKYLIAFLVCVLAGVGIGWYWGHSTAISAYQRENLPKVLAVSEAFVKQRAEHDRLAKPYEASGASKALWVLQSLDTNDVDGAKSELVQTIANYYQTHRDGGDTDILAAITAFAAKDAALSNAIYHK